MHNQCKDYQNHVLLSLGFCIYIQIFRILNSTFVESKIPNQLKHFYSEL
jgi:hypothetical protein